MKIVSIVAFIPNFFFVLAYDNAKTWLLLALGTILLGSITKVAELKTNRIYVLLTGIIVTAFFGLTLIPVTKNTVLKHTYPTDVSLSFKESWNAAISTMRDFPIVGTGPSTFYLNYPRYKSVAINQTALWNMRVDKPQSEALLVIGSLGILGILATSYFGITIIKETLKFYKNEGPEKISGVLTILMGATFFISTETVVTGFVFTLFLAFMEIMSSSQDKKYLSFAATKTGPINSLETEMANDNEGFITAVIALPLLALATLGFITIYKAVSYTHLTLPTKRIV